MGEEVELAVGERRLAVGLADGDLGEGEVALEPLQVAPCGRALALLLAGAFGGVGRSCRGLAGWAVAPLVMAARRSGPSYSPLCHRPSNSWCAVACRRCALVGMAVFVLS